MAALENDKYEIKLIEYYFLKINHYASENICQIENNKIEQKYITLFNGNINNMIQSDELEQTCKTYVSTTQWI